MVTSGQQNLTPPHPPKDASPAGLVELAVLLLLLLLLLLVHWCMPFFLSWCYKLCFPLCRLLSIAEETLAEFLSKATGTAVEWVQMPGMKVTSSFLLYASICIDNLSHRNFANLLSNMPNLLKIMLCCLILSSANVTSHLPKQQALLHLCNGVVNLMPLLSKDHALF